MRQTDQLDDLLLSFTSVMESRRPITGLVPIGSLRMRCRRPAVWPKLAENDYISIRLFKNHNGHVTV